MIGKLVRVHTRYFIIGVIAHFDVINVFDLRSDIDISIDALASRPSVSNAYTHETDEIIPVLHRKIIRKLCLSLNQQWHSF